jgi:hypothetical protein
MASDVVTIPRLGDLRARSDAELMRFTRDLAAARRRVDAATALVAAELARRSDRSLGYDGLAQKLGARTPEKLVSRLAGVSVPEARTMVSAGETMTEGGGAAWLDAVGSRVAQGDLSVGAAAAIREGLGEPNADVADAALAEAAGRLAEEAMTMSPAEAARAARLARDELDAAGVADREAVLRERRYLRLFPQADGMTRIAGLLDPESAALVSDAFDRVTMPRRGGPRFVDPAEQQREQDAADDTRTIDQVTADAFVQFVKLAGGIDDGAVFGIKAPAVRVHVRLADLQRGAGAGVVEGQTAPVSIATVHRFICEGGVVPILFDDDGQAVNVGRTIRPFTERQRVAIAARDGGCMIPGCDRPPSWTEAHHCHEWGMGGPTDLSNGVALCRHHHMWLHNTGRWIEYTGAGYLLHAPDGSPPERLVSKHPLAREWARAG